MWVIGLLEGRGSAAKPARSASEGDSMSGKRRFGIAAAFWLVISQMALTGLARAGDEKDPAASHAAVGATANAGSGSAGAIAAAPLRPPAADSNAAIAAELQELKSEVEAQRAALDAQMRRI